MEIKTIIISAVVVVLGVFSVVAGFAAEATKVKAHQVDLRILATGPKCFYPSSPAMGFGIAGAVSLVLIRIIVSAATHGRCTCCGTVTNLSRFARVCSIIAWVASIIGLSQFIRGVHLSDPQNDQMVVGDEYVCYVLKSGVFTVAAVMAIVSLFFTLVYFLSYASAKTVAVEPPEMELEGAPVKAAAGKPPSPAADVQKA